MMALTVKDLARVEAQVEKWREHGGLERLYGVSADYVAMLTEIKEMRKYCALQGVEIGSLQGEIDALEEVIKAAWDDATFERLVIRQAVITSQASLDALPAETVIRDKNGTVLERWWGSSGWIKIGSKDWPGHVEFPARVLYLPDEVKKTKK